MRLLFHRWHQQKTDFLNGLHRFHYDHPAALENISRTINRMLELRYTSFYSGLVILCIGTDRSTGDCLGPLIGAKFSDTPLSAVDVYGTLDDPVHAVNLREVMNRIQAKHNKPFILAIDACLGRSESVGYISIKNGPLQPGTGVNKNLPDVGDIHIVGVVNVGGFMEYMVLQNTRLSLVVKMADIIFASLRLSLSSFPSPAHPVPTGAEHKLIQLPPS
ncbi:MAG: spore protease YyaC [Bacillota bacterium]